jgi:hypothetical protein
MLKTVCDSSRFLKKLYKLHIRNYKTHDLKIYHMTTKYSKWSQSVPNGLKIVQMAIKYVYQHFPFLGPKKFTRVGIFGMKIWNYQPTLLFMCVLRK